MATLAPAQVRFPEYSDPIPDEALAQMHALVAQATALRTIITSRSITPAVRKRLPGLLRDCKKTSTQALAMLKAGQP